MSELETNEGVMNQALRSKQEIINGQREMFGPADVKHMGDVLTECDALQAKLTAAREALTMIVAKCSGLDAYVPEIGDIADKALKEIK